MLKPNDELSSLDVVLTTHINIYMDTSESKEIAWFVEAALPGFQPQRSAEIIPLQIKNSASSHVFIPSEGVTEMKTVVNKFLFSCFLHHKVTQADVADRKKQKHIHVPM